MFLVTFHKTVSNVYAYDDTGVLQNPTKPKALSKCHGYDFDELRGIYVSNGYLYVVNGGKSTSNILCFSMSSGPPYRCTGAPFIGAGGAIDHPFAMVFDGAGHAFVSNQDSNVVATLNVTSDTSATLAPTSAYLMALYPDGTFLPGTLVGSSVSPLPKVPATTPIPLELGGLGVSETGDGSNPAASKTEKVQNSVRDVAYLAGPTPLLFVLDEPEGIVRVYNPVTGQPLLNSNPIPGPTHLLIEGGTIYVSAGYQVMTAPVPNPYDPQAPVWLFTPLLALDSKDAASGMAFDAGGGFYVAGRLSQQVFVYDSNNNFAPGTPWDKLPDNPEFLLYTGG